MAGEQNTGSEEPQEGAENADSTHAGQNDAQQGDGKPDGRQDRDGQGKDDSGNGSSTDGSDGSPSFDDFLSGLDETQQKLVRDEIDRRDRDLRKARNEAKNLRERVTRTEPKAAKYDEAVDAQKSAEDKARETQDALRNDNEGLRKRLVAERVRVLAASKFADPDDAAAFLDPAEFLSDDLEPDSERISDALADLLERKPHLGRQDPKPRPPASTKAQGSSGNGAPSLDQQIAAARKSGDHTKAMQLEMQKLAPTSK